MNWGSEEFRNSGFRETTCVSFSFLFFVGWNGEKDLGFFVPFSMAYVG